MSQTCLLMVADSERNADMRYAVGMSVPAPFIYLRWNGHGWAMLNDLELDRGRREAQGCRVVSLSRWRARVRRAGVKAPGLADVIAGWLRERDLKRVQVPETFPLGLARQLRRLKVRLKVKPGALFAAREIKSDAEVKKISAAVIMAEVGLAEGLQALKQAKIAKDGRLLYHNAPLTSEKLRAIIETAVLQAGGFAGHTLVAGGRQACDPHEAGHGPLKAGQPIVIDVFPRSQRTGYHGDITRTVVKGRAPDRVREMYETVKAAQTLGLARLQPDVPAREVHAVIRRHFTRHGYRSGRRRGHMEGFFHGTGHGVGLEIHEAPRLSATSKDLLRAGQVVAIEPGLYYPGLGAVRLEDVALITDQGARNLTEFERVLEV